MAWKVLGTKALAATHNLQGINEGRNQAPGSCGSKKLYSGYFHLLFYPDVKDKKQRLEPGMEIEE